LLVITKGKSVLLERNRIENALAGKAFGHCLKNHSHQKYLRFFNAFAATAVIPAKPGATAVFLLASTRLGPIQAICESARQF
jgi:hypothetical protein